VLEHIVVYGPKGNGKTTLVRYLAAELGLPLLQFEVGANVVNEASACFVLLDLLTFPQPVPAGSVAGGRVWHGARSDPDARRVQLGEEAATMHHAAAQL
jgi:hypothetical protein